MKDHVMSSYSHVHPLFYRCDLQLNSTLCKVNEKKMQVDDLSSRLFSICLPKVLTDMVSPGFDHITKHRSISLDLMQQNFHENQDILSCKNRKSSGVTNNIKGSILLCVQVDFKLAAYMLKLANCFNPPPFSNQVFSNTSLPSQRPEWNTE